MTTENDRDVELLRTDPNQLVVKYQTIVEIIVKKYIASGLFAAPELDDIVQSVNVSLLTKLPAVQRQYRGTALLKTYLSGIVRNICLELFERSTRRVKTVGLDGDLQRAPEELTDRDLIDHAVSRFGHIIDLYHSQRPRVLFCLKLYFRIRVLACDVTAMFPQCSATDLEGLLRSLDGGYEKMNDYEIYRIVTPIMNKYEHKSNSEDALRKWTHSKIQEILHVLNGKPPKAAFDKDTLQILVEDYFSPFLETR